MSTNTVMPNCPVPSLTVGASPPLLEHRVSSIEEYVATVLRIFNERSAVSGRLWFRGTVDVNLDLVPRFVWHYAARGTEVDEDSLIEEFYVAGAALPPELRPDRWALYALMQHHRLPTRLLDWTKSALIALYFCLEGDCLPAGSRGRGVWVMDPYRLNEACTGKSVVFCPSSLSSGTKEVDCDDWLPASIRPPGKLGAKIPECPIAIEPPYSNRRLYAQQGCFTLHGSSAFPLTHWLGSGADWLQIIVIDESVREDLRESLFCLGVREDAVYQDFDSLSNRIRREFDQCA